MEELLVVVCQFVFEFILNVLANIPFDWPLRDRKTPEPESITLRRFFWLRDGCPLAGASLLVFKSTLISVPALRIANLVFAPVVSGFISKAIADRRSLKNELIISRNHFWQTFWLRLV